MVEFFALIDGLFRFNHPLLARLKRAMTKTEMKMQLTITRNSWPIAGTFTIARGSKTSAETVTVTLSDGKHVGHGECVPYARYKETVDGVVSALEFNKSKIAQLHTRDEIAALALPYAARNALDCAMWDLAAKRTGKPVWQLAGVNEPHAVTTAYTISLGDPGAMAEAAKAASHRPLLKIKLGHDGDGERLASIREAVPHARLIVDANEGWRAHSIEAMLEHCVKQRVELVEQPLPADDDEALRGIKTPVILCADESAHGLESLDGLLGKYHAINIKLDKTGGLTPSLAMARAAKARDLKIMIGCMVGSSLAMAPAFLLAGYADYVDLDGPLLLAKDREHAIQYDGGTMQPPLRALWG
jgi:L-Ala-D/L-Glu epimerase